MSNQTKALIGQTFLELADMLEHGAPRVRIGIAGMGSEHGEPTMMEGAMLAMRQGIETVYFGTLTRDGIRTIQVADEEACRKAMDAALDAGEIDAAVMMHYPFPIGVSTVGRVVTPGRGRELYLATTTGTASSERVEGMVRNALYGIIAAKACGIENPTVGILNLEGAQATQGVLKQLQRNGYPIEFASSQRADGGCIMRGNDLLNAACDVMVADPLTGNVLMKTLSAYTTGGSYEAMGYGYGPGIGADYERIVMIVSRASGAPVVANAAVYAAQLVRGNLRAVAAAEFAAAEQAGLCELFSQRRKEKTAPQAAETTAKRPPREVVTGEILGVEITDIEDAAEALMAGDIYAECGMGCTGPVVLVAEGKVDAARSILIKSGYLSE